MIRKIFFILVVIGIYIGIMSIDDGDTMVEKAQGTWTAVIEKLEDMGFKMHVNKWVYDKRKKRFLIQKITK